MDHIETVLFARYAGKQWCYNGRGIEGLHWTDATPKPTEAELLAQVDDVLAEQAVKKSAKAVAAASGRAKLAALGLTDDEINALLGA